MALRTKRLGGTAQEPFTLEVETQMPFASVALAHMARLPGVEVVAKKSWVLTDDFEAYFLYKERLYIMSTPFVNVWLSQIGQPPNERQFCELEAHLQQLSLAQHFLGPWTFLQFVLLPFNPPRALLERYQVPTGKLEQ